MYNPTMNGNPGSINRTRSPGVPSPPSSVGRSSTANSIYPSSDPAIVRKQVVLEEQLFNHYQALKDFLASFTASDGPQRPNRARDKLVRLSAVQFQELSTDVFDELQRRKIAEDQQRKPGASAAGNRGPPHLLPRDNFHPKRNQARQKLATLPLPKFRDLGTDVFHELARRFPGFSEGQLRRGHEPSMSISSIRGPPSRAGTPGPALPSKGIPVGRELPALRPRRTDSSDSYGLARADHGNSGSISSLAPPPSPGINNPFDRPQQRTFQNNTIIPNKSTFVEDEGDQTGPDDDYVDDDGFESEGRTRTNRSTAHIPSDSTHSELQAQLDSLQRQLLQKDQELIVLRSENSAKRELRPEQERWTATRKDLEQRVADANKLQSSLKAELVKLRAEHATQEQRLQKDLEATRRGSDRADGELKERYEGLTNEIQQLRMQLNEQERVTTEVRKQATQSLTEMKALSGQATASWDNEEHLRGEIAKLEEEVGVWKGRYAKAKTQFRNLRASSAGMSIPGPNAAQFTRDGAFMDPEGLVKDVHVTGFQIAIDDLLRNARMGDPSSMLDFMKPVVVSIRNVTKDIDDRPVSGSHSPTQRLKLKQRVSATANNLITASKNFRSSNGISPVSLLDAAASHLTIAVVDLIKVVKIRPTPEDELEDDEVGEDSRGRMGDGLSTNLPVPSNSRRSDDSSYSSQLGSARASQITSKHRSGKESWSARRPPSRTSKSTSGPGMQSMLKMGLALRSPALGPFAAEGHIEELKLFLEEQTENLVRSIQAMVASIRQEAGQAEICNHIDSICAVVASVLSQTESAAKKEQGHLDTLGDNVKRLSGCLTKLEAARGEGERSTEGKSLREWSKKLPPMAFEVARETKVSSDSELGDLR